VSAPFSLLFLLVGSFQEQKQLTAGVNLFKPAVMETARKITPSSGISAI